MRKTLLIHPSDGVAVALVELAPGETLDVGDGSLTARERIPAGHKVALRAHEAGESVTKYGYPSYFVEHGQPVHENPAPGNKDGGITTLEEKSLGCVQKGGDAPITDVVAYGARAQRPGLTLLQAPGNDQVSTTALVAAGATLVLFTTGRGTPLGSPAPTLKVSTNQELSRRKPGWIDFDAGVLASRADRAEVDARFLDLVLEVASGRRTRNELQDQRDIGIFKDGVTL